MSRDLQKSKLWRDNNRERIREADRRNFGMDRIIHYLNGETE